MSAAELSKDLSDDDIAKLEELINSLDEDDGLETAKFINACKISSNKKKWVEVK